MKKRILVGAAGIVIVLAVVTAAMAADPFVGTWKMNPAKSKFSNSNMILKSYTITHDDQNKIVEDMVDGNGNATHRAWVEKYDGKDCPVTAPDMDSISLKKPNTYTIEYVAKKNGKEVCSGRSVMSKDGKSVIDAGGGKDEKGQAYTYSIFLEKQ